MIAIRTLSVPRAQAALEGEPFHTWTFPDGTPWTEFHRLNGGYLLRFPDLADFRVSGRVESRCPAPVGPAYLFPPLSSGGASLAGP